MNTPANAPLPIVERLTQWLAAPPPESRPWVTLSYAQSLDACLTLARGSPTAISGAESLRLTHAARAAHTAILIGVGTLLADNPRLTARIPNAMQPQPVILDSTLRTPINAHVLQHPLGAWIITTPAAPEARATALQARGAHIVRVNANAQGQVNLPEALAHLRSTSIASVMVEGGAQILSALLTHRLADFALITIAPLLLGGLPALQLPAARRPLHTVHWQPCGQDMVLLSRL
ncbi:MAG: hypothetical protein OHK0052_25000 [Anaerolineales bacterium]